MQVNSSPATQTENDTTSQSPEFGAGRFSKVMSFAYDQMQKLFGTSPSAAEHIAREVARQVGVILKADKFTSDLKVGAVTKDGKLSIAEVSRLSQRGTTSTPELELFHACQWWQDAGKHGFSYADTKLVLMPTLADKLKAIELDHGNE